MNTIVSTLRRTLLLASTLSVVLAMTRSVSGDDAAEASPGESAPEEAPMPDVDLNLNWQLKTLGGRQVWGDVANFRGWRIQQNVVTKHYRLIDPEDVRRAWGSEEQCRVQLDECIKTVPLQPLSGKAVILIHGIIRSSKAMAAMRERLAADGYLVISLDYPSTRVTIPESAAYLRRVIESLDGVEQIHFVVHSMGGLIVRSYLAQTTGHPDPRLGRMVMLGVPNLGARLANIARNNLLFKTLFGPAGQQLIEDQEGLIAGLPTPAFEFAVVAGARGDDDGYNPLIPGDDDGVVSVDSTRLPGAADFLTVPCIHTFLPSNSEVIESTRRFLATGALRVSGEREGIPAIAPKNVAPMESGDTGLLEGNPSTASPMVVISPAAERR